MTKEDRLKMFANELSEIRDEQIRKFATILIEDADDYFFSVPASSSGNYHPKFSLGDGGLVRHTKCVVFYSECISESFNFDDRTRDMLIVCAIAHDIKKQGDGKGKHTVKEHPLLAAEFFLNEANKMDGVFSDEEKNTMANAIRAHMGKWCKKDGLPVPETEFEKCLQAADYIASRKEILSFNFKGMEAESTEKEEPKTESPGDVIINFGKYKGKGMTIREIHEAELRDPNKKDDTYIEWFSKLKECAMPDIQDAARRFLDEYNRKPPVVKAATASIPDDLPF